MRARACPASLREAGIRPRAPAAGRKVIAARSAARVSLLPAINDLPPRTAMGLPEGYAEQEWSALERAAAGLLAFDPGSLPEIAENPDEPFARRHAAGQIA